LIFLLLIINFKKKIKIFAKKTLLCRPQAINRDNYKSKEWRT